ncbi:flagellar hook-length control protein FliK [Cupriavidus pauculus]|uniref:flagellar hook-length control protein FliK n=1 Tax=Cupriavidus pauculus TaxID=82633 RepID=UPI001EE2D5FF|nr:flagellar hook-length control protein FliK [Cupriavidus pauculus]GJG94148.1 flagellar hook-length control protein FliK [Cupriavidus pauculus]
MTGIQIPSSLIPQQAPDPQLSRPALAIDKLAALMPVPEVSQGNVQTSTGEAAQARQPNALGPGGTDPRLAGQPGSTRETLSFAAKAILDLFEGGSAAPARPATPLLAASPTGNPAATQDLASALARFVDQSGLFYESHVTQWVMGQRPLSELLQEPQAALRNPAQSPTQMPAPSAQPQAQPAAPAPAALLPYGGPAAPGALPPPSATILAELTRPVIYPLSTGIPAQAAHGQPQAANAQPAASNAAALQPQTPQSPAAEQRLAAHASAAAHAYQVTAEISQEGHHVARAQHAAIVASWNAPDSSATQAQPDRGPPIHPSSEGVVRQQLELLASQQFRATIDAWPGMPVDWEITRDYDREAGGTTPEAATWSTRLRLNLPQLGSVDAVLTLGAQGLEARLVAADSDAAARLIQGRADFRSQLDARGIALLNLNVSTQDTPSTPTVIALPA